MRLLGLQLLCMAARARNGNRVTVTQQLSWRGPVLRAPPQRACQEQVSGLRGWARMGDIWGQEGGDIGKEERSPHVGK